MHNISMAQAFSIWTELMECLYNDNKYGSDICEIYQYRVMPNQPTLNFDGESMKEMNFATYKRACESLYDLVSYFEQETDTAVDIITSYGSEKIEKILSMGDFHRVHLRVRRK